MLPSLLLYLLAGLCEIGGGYLLWIVLRDHKAPWLGAIGFLLLGLYGILPTLQPTPFSRTYAAYGGLFIALSLLWGWVIDHNRPDRFDWLGSAIVLFGILIILYSPRSQ